MNVAGGTHETDNSIVFQFLVSRLYFLLTSKKRKCALSLNQCRKDNALVPCDEYLYVFGGYNNFEKEYLSSSEQLFRFDKERQSIQSKQTSRRWLPAVKCNGVIYGIGGKSDRDISTTLKTLEKYYFVKINRKLTN